MRRSFQSVRLSRPGALTTGRAVHESSPGRMVACLLPAVQLRKVDHTHRAVADIVTIALIQALVYSWSVEVRFKQSARSSRSIDSCARMMLSAVAEHYDPRVLRDQRPPADVWALDRANKRVLLRRLPSWYPV